MVQSPMSSTMSGNLFDNEDSKVKPDYAVTQ